MDTKEEFLTLRVPVELKVALQKLADDNHRTRSDEVRFALSKHVAESAA